MPLTRSLRASLAALVFAASALAACAHETPAAESTAPPPASQSIARGRHLAEVNCATCHAIGRDGESRHPTAPPFRQLSRDYPVNQIEEAFAEGILVGHPIMPEFRLPPEDIDALLSYIQSIQEQQAS